MLTAPSSVGPFCRSGAQPTTKRHTVDSLNITFSFARDLVIISEGSIKQLLKNFVHFENAILLITEE